MNPFGIPIPDLPLIRFWSVYIDAGNTNTEFGGFLRVKI